MKTVLLVLDGIADEPIEALDGKTPLEIAKTPALKTLTASAETGRLRLADPAKAAPSEETTCLGLLGYTPAAANTARGPLSAAAMELKTGGDEWLMACRLVTAHDTKLVDARAGGIGERESTALFESLNRLLKDRDMRIYTDDGRRHVLAIRAKENFWKLAEQGLTAPDESVGKSVWGAWSRTEAGTRLKSALADAAELLETHEINKVRVDLNENPANSLWAWGAGKPLQLDPFPAARGAVILSSSDVWKGAARATGVEWAPAEMTSSLEASGLSELLVRAADRARTHELIIVHLDEADRSGIRGDFKKKIRWIEAFDQYLIGPLSDRLPKGARIAVVSGHVTSSVRRERSSSEAPYLLWTSGSPASAAGTAAVFSEEAASRGKLVANGADFLNKITQ